MRNVLLILAVLAAGAWTATAIAGGDRDASRFGRGPRVARDGGPDRDGDRPHGPPRRGPYGEGRPPFGRRHVPPMFQELTDEQVEEILAFVKEKMPWRYEQLKQWQEEKPDFFRRMCRRLRFEIGQLKRLKKDNPKAYEAAMEEHRLRARAAELAARARQTESETDRQKAKAELREVLARLFDAEGKAREAQIHELEERIHQLREQLAERARQRERIIEHMLEFMISGPQKPDDDEPPPPESP
jgi:hypothetical protein